MSDKIELPGPGDWYIDEQDKSVGNAPMMAWTIESLGSADWALSRVGDLEAEIAENESIAAEAIARIEERTRLLNERANRGVRFFRGKLAEYAEAHRAELLKGGKAKSRKLLHGQIAWRAKGGGLVVTDAAALLAWAQRQPAELELTRVKEEPALAAIKAHAEANGLIPPGMTATESTDELKITATGLGLVKGNGNGDE